MQGPIAIVLVVCAVVGALSLAASAVALVVIAWATRGAVRHGRRVLSKISGAMSIAQELSRRTSPLPDATDSLRWDELIRGHSVRKP